jgi:hypothetical protein
LLNSLKPLNKEESNDLGIGKIKVKSSTKIKNAKRNPFQAQKIVSLEKDDQ